MVFSFFLDSSFFFFFSFFVEKAKLVPPDNQEIQKASGFTNFSKIQSSEVCFFFFNWKTENYKLQHNKMHP